MTCKVSCFDLKEVKHTVEVSAGSVYEAVAQALRIFRDNDWVEDIGHGQTPISVKVKHPEIEHMVRVQDFERWLEARRPAARINGTALKLSTKCILLSKVGPFPPAIIEVVVIANYAKLI
jgi:hypothetical protein